MCKYQSWFRVNQRCSALKFQCFRAKKISAERRWFRAVQLWNSADFFSSEQRWFRENQSWSALKQSWSALMFIMFSESALKNVKTMKQRCSALITSGTSTREWHCSLYYWYYWVSVSVVWPIGLTCESTSFTAKASGENVNFCLESTNLESKMVRNSMS